MDVGLKKLKIKTLKKMKNIKTILVSLITLLIASCSSTSYYQVYKTTASEKINLKENSLVYEDQNCIISYDFWANEGDVGYKFYNKTEKNIYLNLDESYFILNGISNNYYKNRIFTNSQNSGVIVTKGASAAKSVSGYNFLDLLQSNLISTSSSVGKTSSSGTSVAFNEEKIVCIPPKTAKIITEYNINQTLFRDCELLRYPSKKEIKSKHFTKSNSPIIFSNIISYKTAQSDILNKVQNEFFVSEITNLPKSEMISSKYEEFCGSKNVYKTDFFVEPAPNSFYIQYLKIQNGIKN